MKFKAFEPIDLKGHEPKFAMVSLNLWQILPNKKQPRKNFDKDALDTLAASIAKRGVMQPIIVRSVSDDKYEIIAGERRWQAAKQAGLEQIPALIAVCNPWEGQAMALIENIQRENLNPLEEAQAIQSLLAECDLTHQQLAVSIGRSRAMVSNLLRLLTLTDEVQWLLHAGLLEMGHARALLCLPAKQQLEVAGAIVQKKLSVRETEKWVQRLQVTPKKTALTSAKKCADKTLAWETQLAQHLGVTVNVHCNPQGQGKVVIHFASFAEGEWLMAKLKPSPHEKGSPDEK
jgi:ParB family transcriptional regulator, chromosome partitioning protein